MRTMLFYRHFRRFRGGHLKVWDYFNHVLASPHFTPRVGFSERSDWDETNPWRAAPDYVVDSVEAVRPDAFFLAGKDWEMLDRHPDGGAGLPVINLIQGVRHADPRSSRFQYLERRAIRVCVSEEVKEAVAATGLPRGPLIAIPNGVDLEPLAFADGAERDVDVLVIALKQRPLGKELATRLERPGRRVAVQTKHLPRGEFLDRIRQARTTVFLPIETEGFYLPALEGMALGTVVVCPDCVGNRSFCLDGHNAFRPDYGLDELVRATEQALALSPPEAQQLRARAQRTAEAHSLPRERRAFLDVLDDLDGLWAESS